MLLVHLSVSFVNCSLVVYLSLILDDEINVATAPAPALPQAPSQHISHDDLGAGPSVSELGSVHYEIKSAMTCNFVALFFELYHVLRHLHYPFTDAAR
jgi:hypothetical protein